MIMLSSNKNNNETSISATKSINVNKIIEINYYYRSKLKNSLTYLISHGYFPMVRRLIQTRAGNDLDLNETDEWWVVNPDINLMYKKCLLARRDKARILNRLQSSLEYSSGDKAASNKGMIVARTALMLCSLIEDDSWAYSIAQMLLENGAQLSHKDSHGFNALMYACLYERSNIAELILNAPGGDFNLLDKDNYGNTAFHLASLSRDDKLCFILAKLAQKFGINREAKINRNHFHHLPSDLCRLKGHEKCIQLLNSNFSTTSSLDTTVSKKIKINIVPILKIDNNDTLILNKSPRSSPPFLFSNYSLNANNQTSTTNDIMSDELQLILKCRKRLLSTYKIVFSLKESLIKLNGSYVKKVEKPSRDDYVVNNKLATPTIVTRTRQSISAMGTYYNQLPIVPPPSNQHGIYADPQFNPIAASLSWRSNVDKLFEAVEFQKTKSYRTPNNNLATNLFDQVFQSVNGGETQTLAHLIVRKNSLTRGKANSQMSMHSGENGQHHQQPKQSNNTGSIKSSIKSVNTLRRTSVISNK